MNLRTAATTIVAAGNARGWHSIASLVTAPVVAPIVAIVCIVGRDRTTGSIVFVTHLALDVGPIGITFGPIAFLDSLIVASNHLGIFGTVRDALGMPAQPILDTARELANVIFKRIAGLGPPARLRFSALDPSLSAFGLVAKSGQTTFQVL